MESMRTDLMQTKEDKMRFELGLRNKDSEVSRLQMLFDREKENRERDDKELRKQINFESDRYVQAVRESERNLAKSLMHEELIARYKKDIEAKGEIIKQKELEIESYKNKMNDQERKFNIELSKEKDRIKEELMLKVNEKSRDTSVDDFKNQILSLTRQNEELLRKCEGLI